MLPSKPFIRGGIKKTSNNEILHIFKDNDESNSLLGNDSAEQLANKDQAMADLHKKLEIDQAGADGNGNKFK